MTYNNNHHFYRGDRSVEGKCNNEYCNDLVRTRDTIEWLRYYDCFRDISPALEDANIIYLASKQLSVDCVSNFVVRDKGVQNEESDENENQRRDDDAGYHNDDKITAVPFLSLQTKRDDGP